MKRAWKRFYAWAHTDLGDSIVCGVAMLVIMVSVWAGSWLIWFMGGVR